MNQLINDEAVYRTAPATPDLLMRKMKLCLDMEKEKHSSMTLVKNNFNGHNIKEEDTGRLTKGYTGLYKCDGKMCSCSFYNSQRRLCRHVFFFRKTSNIRLFDIDCFEPSLRLHLHLQQLHVSSKPPCKAGQAQKEMPYLQ